VIASRESTVAQAPRRTTFKIACMPDAVAFGMRIAEEHGQVKRG
jgi:hypothetical protein